MAESYVFPVHSLLDPVVGEPDDVQGWLDEMRIDLASRGEDGAMLTLSRLQAMHDFFEEPSQDLASIAERIDAWVHVDDSYTQPDYMFWQAIADAAKKLTNHHDRLLDLIVAIHRLAPEGTKESLSFNEVFGQFQGWRSTGTQESVKKFLATAYVAELFMAKLALRGLTASEDEPEAVKNLSSWLERGASAIRAELENTAWDPESTTFAYADGDVETLEIPSEYQVEPKEGDQQEAEEVEEEEELVEAYKSVHALNYAILFVEPWLKMCGGELYDACKAGGTFPCDVPDQHAPTNFGIGKGYCLERWDFWRSRLEEISVAGELDVATRQVAKDCLETMTKIEREKQRG
ncbi:hypothetical protein MAPG_07277 [Magnaporthiopsis poae ATCC 64411]|uniref:Uncharacterized protein n=1 Tax=Magnaporthiopsis poae (strain ATCC 64411 / 73-15) TaxID=644358 RepID=A0A0C4E486_MAGP6|nr:hypothetical protein MAPG_07277 [Magnaporthiopsis poae ATCC 64411]